MAKLVEEFLSLEATPTWAVATVCFGLISISLLIEYALLLLAKHFNKKQRKSLTQVLDKIKSGDHNSATIFTNGYFHFVYFFDCKEKNENTNSLSISVMYAELMLLGFISLFLTISQKPIAKICIPTSVGESFLPCKAMTSDGVEESKCEEQGKLSLMSRTGMQQLQMLIFVLAFFHVFSSFLTFSLGLAKMKRWESWEAETKTMEYQFSNDPQRFQLINETSFGRQHLKFWSEHRYLRLPVCFLHQFYKSVSKADYLTLRYGFIVLLDLDLFSNFHIPKRTRVLQLFLASVHSISDAIDSWDKATKPSDHFFWFGQPKLLLHLMHFILFQNSFQLAFFTWAWFKFGLRSCFHRETEDIVIKLGMGLLVHILCGYVTLPLYALVAG
ncbi:MLO-like protein 12 [Camellia lanceoleosa]|uniref:MLO-like protein 12 n=1 Tax=Camellia lanceoleosa TaxID=1840588 RepID=A0ACC0GJD4_9ERIC|nr:MLO-like protein 12 [Camellia lanceoleosa]